MTNPASAAKAFAACLLLSFWGSCACVPYTLILDSGSSGTRIYAYTWTKGAPTGVPGQLPHVEAVKPSAAISRIPRKAKAGMYERVETQPGLAHYLNDPKGLSRHALVPLLDWAKAVVPPKQWKHTPLFLLATAGVRKLAARDQEQLLASVRAVLTASGFRFEPTWARVISGAEEGAFGWVAANYLSGTPNPAASAPLAASHAAQLDAGHHQVEHVMHVDARGLVNTLDLGGSSMEVTVLLPTGSVDDGGGVSSGSTSQITSLMVGGTRYNLTTRTYRRFGLTDTFDRSVAVLLQEHQDKSSLLALVGQLLNPPLPALPRANPQAAPSHTASASTPTIHHHLQQSTDSNEQATQQQHQQAAAAHQVQEMTQHQPAANQQQQQQQEHHAALGDPTVATQQASGNAIALHSQGSSGVGLGSSNSVPASQSQSATAITRLRVLQATPGAAPSQPIEGIHASASNQAQHAHMAARESAHVATVGAAISWLAGCISRARQQLVEQFHALAISSRVAGTHSTSRESTAHAINDGISAQHGGGAEGVARRSMRPIVDTHMARQGKAGDAVTQDIAEHAGLMGAQSGQHSSSSSGSSSSGEGRVAGATWAAGDSNSSAVTAGAGAGKADSAVSVGSDTSGLVLELDHPCLAAGFSTTYTRLQTYGIVPLTTHVRLIGAPDTSACRALATTLVTHTLQPCEPANTAHHAATPHTRTQGLGSVHAALHAGTADSLLGRPGLHGGQQHVQGTSMGGANGHMARHRDLLNEQLQHASHAMTHGDGQMHALSRGVGEISPLGCGSDMHQNPLQGHVLALTGFYVVWRFFLGAEAGQSPDPERLRAAVQHACARPWLVMRAEMGHQANVEKYCLWGQYVVELVGSQGLALNPGQLSIGSGDVGWPLGATLSEVSRELPELMRLSASTEHRSWLSWALPPWHSHLTSHQGTADGHFRISFGLIILPTLMLVAISLVLSWFRYKWRRVRPLMADRRALAGTGMNTLPLASGRHPRSSSIMNLVRLLSRE